MVDRCHLAGRKQDAMLQPELPLVKHLLLPSVREGENGHAVSVLAPIPKRKMTY